MLIVIGRSIDKAVQFFTEDVFASAVVLYIPTLSAELPW